MKLGDELYRMAQCKAHSTGAGTGVAGVDGTSTNSPGVQGTSTNGTGVKGTSTGSYGVFGTSTNHAGIFGTSTSTSTSTNGIGVQGQSASTNGIGIQGTNTGGVGVYGYSGTSYAGWFVGKVYVSGPLTKAGGGFKIDHPLDPANRYLTYSFVESSEMKNIYDGVVTLDHQGQAEVELPIWFEALGLKRS